MFWTLKGTNPAGRVGSEKAPGEAYWSEAAVEDVDASGPGPISSIEPGPSRIDGQPGVHQRRGSLLG